MVIAFNFSNPVCDPSGRDEGTDPISLAASPFVFTVPHASGALPHWIRSHDGVAQWNSHIAGSHHALDRGSLGLAASLAKTFKAPHIVGSFSRVLIDLNRPLDDPTAIPLDVGGTEVHLNQNIVPGDLAARRHAHRSFHAKVRQTLISAQAIQPILIDQHSYDRRGPDVTDRIVDIGICAPGNTIFAEALFKVLDEILADRAAGERPDPHHLKLNVRWNEPYSADHPGAYIMRTHAKDSVVGTVIEVCDDLLGDAERSAKIAEILALGLREAAKRIGSVRPDTSIDKGSVEDAA